MVVGGFVDDLAVSVSFSFSLFPFSGPSSTTKCPRIPDVDEDSTKRVKEMECT